MDRYYLVHDYETGDEFIVLIDKIDDPVESKAKALETAQFYFNTPKIVCKVSSFWAELSGLDVY